MNPSPTEFVQEDAKDAPAIVRALNRMLRQVQAIRGARYQVMRFDNVTGASRFSIRSPFPVDAIVAGRAQCTSGGVSLTTAWCVDWRLQSDGQLTASLVGFPSTGTWSISVVLFERTGDVQRPGATPGTPTS